MVQSGKFRFAPPLKCNAEVDRTVLNVMFP